MRFERAEPFHKLWRRQDVRRLIHQVARKVDAFEESFVFLKSARELLPGMRKDRQTRRAAIILRFGFFGVAGGNALRFVFLEGIIPQAEAEREGKRRFAMQRINTLENNVGVRRFCRQLATDGAADFHPFAGIQRFRIANAHKHKAAGGKAMRRKDLDDALSLALESRDIHRLRDGASRGGVDLL